VVGYDYFPSEHHCSLANAKSYSLVTVAYMCKQIAQSHYSQN